MKKVVLFLSMFIILLSTVYGACVDLSPYENITYVCNSTANCTFCTNTYNFSGSSNSIDVNFDNGVIDCNGSTLVDVDAGGNAGIFLHGDDNITVKNCIFVNYEDGIKMWAANGGNITNNTFYNCSGQCVDLAQEANYNVFIENNIAYGNSSSDPYCYSVSKSTNTTLRNNYGYNCNVGGWIQGAKGFDIEGNYFYNMSRQGIVMSESDINFTPENGTVNNNIINKTDIGIMCQNCFNVSMDSSVLVDITGNYDSYMLGIYVFADKNVNISKYISITNTECEYAQGCVWVQKTINASIINTTCNQISLYDVADRVNSTKSWSRTGQGNPIHYFDPTFCVYVGTQYKGWLGDSTESSTDTIDKFRKYNVTDLYVSGITYNSDVQTFLRLQGVYGNIDLDLPTNWYVKLWIPTNMTDADEFYNNPDWDTLQIVPSTNSGISSNFIKSRAGQFTSAFDEVNYTISKDLSKLEFNLVRNQSIVYNMSSSLLINYANDGSLKYIDTITNKQLSILNNSIQIDVVPANYGFFNGTEEDNVSLTIGTSYEIGSGQYWYLIEQDCALEACINEISPSTITNIDVLAGSNYYLVNVSGTGTVNISIENIQGTYGYVDVYRSLSYYATTDSTNYTLTSYPWIFIQSSFESDIVQAGQSACIAGVLGLSKGAKYLPVIVIALIVAIVLGTITVILAFVNNDQTQIQDVVNQNAVGSMVMIALGMGVIVIILIFIAKFISAIFYLC